MRPVWLAGERAFIRYLEIPGADPPLLWLHGWQCASTGELLPAAVQPPLRGRRSLLVDLLGHGYSDKPPDFGYTVPDHARTVVAVIDALGLEECGLVGHSMGGAIAVRVAAARPEVVSVLVLAEGSMDGWDEEPLDGQSEEEFRAHGFDALVAAQRAQAEAQPDGVPAAHLGMTALLEPRAVHREGVSLARDEEPTVRSILTGLQMPRWYLLGELSDPDPQFQQGMAAIGVGWKVVPATGHAMGLQNPAGFADTVAEVLAEAWPGPQPFGR